MGTSSLLELKQLGCGTDLSPQFSAKVKERVELYIYSPSWAFMACIRVKFTYFTLPQKKILPLPFLFLIFVIMNILMKVLDLHEDD